MTTKNILLLGGSKHIGHHVLEILAPRPDEYKLFCIARSSPDTIESFTGKENVNFVQGDAKSVDTVDNVVRNVMGGKVDFVIITVGMSFA